MASRPSARPVRLRRCLWVLAFALLGVSPLDAWAQLNYREPPDLNSNLAIPDNIGAVALGRNTVRGSIDTEWDSFGCFDGDTADAFEFRVPEGLVVNSFRIVVTNFRNANRTTASIRSFSGGTAGHRFRENFERELIDTGSRLLRPGLHDFQVISECNEDGDAVSLSWAVTMQVSRCGNGVVDAGEECDDGNGRNGDCCSAVCTLDARGTACGNQRDDDCTNPDTCNANGVCRANHAPVGTACGDPTDDACTDPDTCNADGVCSGNHGPAGTPCGDQRDDACTAPDTCNLNGVCIANDAPNGTACGDRADTECTDPDTCSGGACSDNHAEAGTACGDQTDGACTDPDTCNADGACANNHAANGTACGDPTDNACTNPDTCRRGTCRNNHVAAGTACGDQTDDGCTAPDTCAAGACLDNHATVGTACGDPTDDACTDPDTCAADGVCVANHADPGAPCGERGVDCRVDDACDGAGVCADGGLAPVGTACGDETDDACTAPDTCGEEGDCLDNHAADGTECEGTLFCAADDRCDRGRCVDGPLDPCAEHEVCAEMTAACLARCGNGVVDDGEQCDEGEGNADVADATCRTDCTSAGCGDGIVDTGEECDDGVDNADVADATCRTDCTPAGCGDGIVDSGEECDDGADNADTLPDRCRTTCALPSCDDDVVDTDEVCEDADAGSESDAGRVDLGADAGPGDVGVDDAGNGPDAEEEDAYALTDDFGFSLDEPASDTGCACDSVSQAARGPTPTSGLLLIAVLAGAAGRRRRRWPGGHAADLAAIVQSVGDPGNQ